MDTECFYGCPIGSLALELHEPDPVVRERLAADLDRRALSQFILTTMEGGVMQARTHRSLDAYDASVRMLRDYLDRLQAAASASSTVTGTGGRSGSSVAERSRIDRAPRVPDPPRVDRQPA